MGSSPTADIVKPTLPATRRQNVSTAPRGPPQQPQGPLLHARRLSGQGLRGGRAGWVPFWRQPAPPLPLPFPKLRSCGSAEAATSSNFAI